MEENPITASIEHLQHCGWTKDEAKNLLRALHSDDPEQLWQFAPEWIEMVGRAKLELAMFDVVAKGLATVTKRDGEWMYALSDVGMEVGKQLSEGENHGG